MKPYFAKGQWNGICDRCGFEYKSDKLKKEWTGFYVCKGCWEPRHEQDFQRGVKDDPSVAWTRPEQADTEVEVDFITVEGVPDGTFDGSL